MITDPAILLFVLIAGHFFFDFAGQGQFMSDAKNPTKPIRGVDWPIVMFGHATIHGGFVAFVTGVWWLGVLEVFAHFIIDVSKSKGLIDFTIDQAYHLFCKLSYFAFVVLHARGY